MEGRGPVDAGFGGGTVRTEDRYRGWVAGRRVFNSLPSILQCLYMPIYLWLDYIGPHPRLVATSSLVAFCFLTALKLKFGILNGSGEMTWTVVILLSLGHVWIPLAVAIWAFPYYAPIIASFFFVLKWFEPGVKDQA